MADLTHDDVQKILKIIDEMGDRDVYLEFGDLKLQVSRSGDPMSVGVVASAVTRATPTAPADSAPAAAPKKASVKTALEIPPGHVAIRAPTMEIFYRASSPGAKPHTEVGARVEPHARRGPHANHLLLRSPVDPPLEGARKTAACGPRARRKMAVTSDCRQRGLVPPQPCAAPHGQHGGNIR